MSKFYVGQKVLVKDCSCGKMPQVEEMIGKVCEIKSIGTDIMVYQEDKKRAWHFLPDDLEPITEPAKEITLNGVTYIRKPEPKPEHEWKFGDVAEHEEYGVVFVGGESNFKEGYIWVVVDKGYGEHASPKTLTFLRRTDLSV